VRRRIVRRRPPGVAPFPLQRRPGQRPGGPPQVENRPGGMGAPTLAKNGGILRISDASLDGFCTTRQSGSGQARSYVERGVVPSSGRRSAWTPGSRTGANGGAVEMVV